MLDTERKASSSNVSLNKELVVKPLHEKHAELESSHMDRFDGIEVHR